MIDETQIFQDYPSAKTILDTMDRIGKSLDYFTERINRVKIVPLSANISAKVPKSVPLGTEKVPLWVSLEISRRTYFRRKKKGLI